MSQPATGMLDRVCAGCHQKYGCSWVEGRPLPACSKCGRVPDADENEAFKVFLYGLQRTEKTIEGAKKAETGPPGYTARWQCECGAAQYLAWASEPKECECGICHRPTPAQFIKRCGNHGPGLFPEEPAKTAGKQSRTAMIVAQVSRVAEAAKCRSCGKDIYWWTNPKGSKVPIDAKPTVVIGLVFDPADPDKVVGLEQRTCFLNHFVTCPHAQQHKKT